MNSLVGFSRQRYGEGTRRYALKLCRGEAAPELSEYCKKQVAAVRELPSVWAITEITGSRTLQIPSTAYGQSWVLEINFLDCTFFARVTWQSKTPNLRKAEDSMKENLLRKLYVEELKDLYSAETQLVKALPKMAEAATSTDLKAGFEAHLEQTQEHVSRLETIFSALNQSPKGKHCDGMEGLIEEGSEMIEEDPDPEELDAGLIGAAQRVEHYEIAGYGCVRTYATLLNEKNAVALLEKTLNEEKETDSKLTELAEAINVEAMNTEQGSDEKPAKKQLKQKGYQHAKK